MSSRELRRLSQHFMNAGYIRGPARVSDEMLSECRSVVADLFGNPGDHYRLNAAGEVARVDRLLERDGIFIRMLQSPAVLEPLEALLGPDIEVERFRHNHVTRVRSGDIPYRLHRDGQHWSNPVVSVFIYLEDSNVDNGCTHVVPATHNLPYEGPQSKGGGGTWADEHGPFRHLLGQALPVPMPAGGVLLVHGLAFHSVGANTSTRSRMALAFACRSVDDLRRSDDELGMLIAGQRRYRGSSATPESGSLALRREA